MTSELTSDAAAFGDILREINVDARRIEIADRGGQAIQCEQGKINTALVHLTFAALQKLQKLLIIRRTVNVWRASV